MRKLLIYILLFLIVSCSLYSQTGWFPCNTGTNNNLTSVYFVNQNTGWTAGYNNSFDYHGVIIRSTNGGTTWITQVDEYNFQPESIFFVDENSGWSSGSRLFGTNRSAVKKTTNGGITWMSITIPDTTISTNSVYFIDQNTGWISGRDINNKVKIFKTINGGLTWSIIDTDFISSNPGPKIQFINNNTGYLAALQLIKTTNGGVNWNISDIGSNVNAAQTYFVNDNTGWVTGYSQHPAVHYIKKTINGGSSWSSQLVYALAAGRSVYSTYFINSNTGWGAGSEYVNSSFILKTTNGGGTWITQTSQTYSYSLSSIFFINENYGWSAGENGRMLRTTDGGGTITAIETISSNIPESYSLEQNYPNPFNPVTYIEFSIPEPDFVKLTVFNSIGKEVKTMINEQLQPGIYRAQFDGLKLSSGVYFYTIQSNKFQETKKLVIIK